MYYLKLNGKILPTPYQYIQDAYEAYYDLKSSMCAVIIDIVYIAD